MRMWMISPDLLCDKHLLGEHLESHMVAGSLNKRRNLEGFLRNRIIEPGSVKSRHDALADEMEKRGFRHKSPMKNVPDLSYLETGAETTVDPERSLTDLASRCKKCSERITSGERS